MASINLQDDGSRLSAPWNKIVSGETSESDSVASPETAPALSAAAAVSVQEQIDMRETERSKENSSEGFDNNNAVKKAVWGKPLNGVVFEEEVVVSSPIRPDYSWPALGEAIKPAVKCSTISESLPPPLPDGPLLPALQVTGNLSPSSHKLSSVNNANPTSTLDQAPSGQRSTKHGSGSTGAYISSNGGVSQRSPASQDSKVETPYNTSGKPVTSAMDFHSKDRKYTELPRGGVGSQPNSGNNPYHQKNSYRRGNGSYHNNYGGKPDQGQGQGRGNQEWNQHRNFNNRDTNMQPQRGSRKGYVRPSVHNSTPFIHPPMPMPMRPFGNNVMYPDAASAMIYVQGPVPPIPGPIYFPFPNPLHGNIVKQIDYYFSNENLVRDTYLRRNMDEQGWVPVSLIAGFKKVSCLTDNVQLILDVMWTSSLVEVQGDKIRRRNDWMRWLMPPPAQYSSASSPKNVQRSLSQDSLTSQLQGISLGEPTTKNQVHIGSSQQSGFERAAVA